MAKLALNGSATVPVRMEVTNSSTPLTSTTAVDTSIRDLMIAVFESIPTQADATATVAAIVTALKTIPQ